VTAALALVLALAPLPLSPAPLPAAARSISLLSPQERQRLPDNTAVMVGKRSVTLGVLRAEHAARVQRFAQAKAMGRATASKLAPQPAMLHRVASGTPINRMIPPGGALVPFKGPSTAGGWPAGFPLPKDYLDYCTAANATACLYLPGNSTYYAAPKGGLAVSVDPLIFDKAVCDFDGGQLNISPDFPGCAFYYPYDYAMNFVPSGTSVSSKMSCAQPSTATVDPRGAIEVKYPMQASGGGGFGFSLTPNAIGAQVTCVVQAYINH
jgi:hypothetical protein